MSGSTDWHKAACVEASVDHDSDALANTNGSQPGSHAARAVLARMDRLWGNAAILSYGFMDRAPLTDFQQNQQNKVRRVVLEWKKYANITFNYVEGGDMVPNIRISFDPNDGSWSFVGKEMARIANDKPTMNLGWVSGNSYDITDEENGVILHEFGHTLGMVHEYQPTLRGEKITLREEAVVELYTSSQGWTKDEVKNQILSVYNTSDISNYSEVDLTYIMMYFMPPEMNEQEIRIKPNNKLSAADKAFMAINYPNFSSPDSTSTSEATLTPLQVFQDALGVAGIRGSTRSTLVNYWLQGDWEQIRYTYIDWCTNIRLSRIGRPTQGVNPNTKDLKLPRGFKDGCLQEIIEQATRQSDSNGNGAAHAVATLNYLWTPGQNIIYTFVQGDTKATYYRRKRVHHTLGVWCSRLNLFPTGVAYSANQPAHIRVWFGDIPEEGTLGWSNVAKQFANTPWNQAYIDANGGTADTTLAFSVTAIPENAAPTKDEDKKVEEKLLFHELGHALGLRHEHESPRTKTTDTPNSFSDMATFFDEQSVMLYPGHELKSNGPMWEQFKDFFMPSSTKYTHLPSKLDMAFLAAVYPFPTPHDLDQLAVDLTTLGLDATQSATLLMLRENAFLVQGNTVKFETRIQTYREKLQEYLNALVPSNSANPARKAVSPSNFKAARDAQVRPPAKATTGPFLDELTKTLSAFFKPSTGQIFALQFPGRFLQQDLYAWDTNKAGIYGQFVKPTVVNESEFRLVDQFYNVGQVIGAPNGISLSAVYEQCLNNLIPGVPLSAINFQKQQSQIRDWLLKDVPTSGWVKDLITAQHTTGSPGDASSSSGPAGAARTVNSSSAIDSKPQFAIANKLSDDNKVNRMELSQALTEEYLAAKQAWELERDDMIKTAKGEDLDALTRRLAHITAIRESQLASKYADAVVRGYSHVIRQYLGYMDIKTPAETLQDAKDSLRESAMSSLDGSMKVYPVQMMPIDWFQSLSTSFTMEDLTINADVIAQQLDIKSRQLDDLNARLALIQSNPKQSIKDLEVKLDAAQEAYDKASADLSTRYTSNVISLAKTCIDENNKFSITDFAAAAKASRIAVAAFDNIEEGMNKLTQTQLAVTQSSRALTALMAAKSLAEASDTAQEIVDLRVQMATLQGDITELTSRLQTLRYQPPPDIPTNLDTNGNPKPSSVEDIDLYPPETSSGGSRWQEMYMKHTVDTKYNASSEQSSASTRSTNVSLFFGSYHSESSESQATSSTTSLSQSVDVEVGFRATLVTVDRGGWFQPQFFKQSSGFHCIDKNISWSKWPPSIKTFQDLVNNEEKTVFDDLSKGLLPAFPTGFIICKDITIRIRMQDTDIKAAGEELEKFAASSAGILCWSTSASDHSKSSHKSYSFVQKADGCVIRIPGPQILGYMLQFTENDETTEVPDKLPDGFLLSDAEYNSALSDKPASRTADPTNPFVGVGLS